MLGNCQAEANVLIRIHCVLFNPLQSKNYLKLSHILLKNTVHKTMQKLNGKANFYMYESE